MTGVTAATADDAPASLRASDLRVSNASRDRRVNAHRPRRGRQPMATPPRSAVAAVASLPVSAPPTGKLSPAPRPNRDQTISAAASPKANAALTLHLASRARRAHAIPNDPSSQTKSLVLLAHRARVAAHRE